MSGTFCAVPEDKIDMSGTFCAASQEVSCSGPQLPGPSRKKAENKSTRACPASRHTRGSSDDMCWIRVSAGRLAARPAPANLETLRAWQATAVVTLQSHSDVVAQGSLELGLKWILAPIWPMKEWVLAPERLLTEMDWRSFSQIDEVIEWLHQGEDVVVHCTGGCHRTGIFLYVLLRRLGATAAEALLSIKKTRTETWEELHRTSKIRPEGLLPQGDYIFHKLFVRCANQQGTTLDVASDDETTASQVTGPGDTDSDWYNDALDKSIRIDRDDCMVGKAAYSASPVRETLAATHHVQHIEGSFGEMLRTEYDAVKRSTTITWDVNSHRLDGWKQSSCLKKSPHFNVWLGSHTLSRVPFTLMLFPKGGNSFAKSRVRGVVQLKCEASLAMTAHANVEFSTAGLAPRKASMHDFSQIVACKLPNGQDIWNFQHAVDSNTGIFRLSVVIYPLDEGRSWHAGDVCIPGATDTSDLPVPASGAQASDDTASHVKYTGKGARGAGRQVVARDALCKYFLKGWCKYGEDCEYKHPARQGGKGIGRNGLQQDRCRFCNEVGHWGNECALNPRCNRRPNKMEDVNCVNAGQPSVPLEKSEAALPETVSQKPTESKVPVIELSDECKPCAPRLQSSQDHIPFQKASSSFSVDRSDAEADVMSEGDTTIDGLSRAETDSEWDNGDDSIGEDGDVFETSTFGQNPKAMNVHECRERIAALEEQARLKIAKNSAGFASSCSASPQFSERRPVESASGRRSSPKRAAPKNPSQKDEKPWPGPEPSDRQKDRLKAAMKNHENMHTVAHAADSICHLHAIMLELEKQDVIPNKNAMRIYLQHCCAKSASFEAAEFALDMMDKQRCRFDMTTVTEIAMQVSLRSGQNDVDAFVRSLVRKTLKHLSENEQLFVTRHMIFALAERKQAFEESLSVIDPFIETDIKLDWHNSKAQEFLLYNAEDGGKKYYKPRDGYGFAKKNLVALLSIDFARLELEYTEHNGTLQGALVEITEANEGEPLVARLRTHPEVPFEKDLCYRLQNIDSAEVQTKRVMESLKVLGHDSQSSKFLPHEDIYAMLTLPPESSYSVQIKSKLINLHEEFDLCEWDSSEPVRVRSIGMGLLAWNTDNTDQLICVGDRVTTVNGRSEKHHMLEQLRSQNGSVRLNLTLMRKNKMEDYGMQSVLRMPNAAEIEEVFCREQLELKEKLDASQQEALRCASTQRVSLIQGPPGTGKTTTAVELIDFLLSHGNIPTPMLVSGQSNAAVDNILMGSARRGRRVVRIGEGDKVHPDCRPYLHEKEKAADLEGAEIVFATCIGSGSGMLFQKGIEFHTVLIDECTQATESSCLVPICHAAKQLILIGDQCQLRPLVKSERAKSEDLGNSLFNRLCQQGMRPVMLNTQYRMHPAICEFPSEAFYNGELLNGVRHDARLPTEFWRWPSSMLPVCFIDAKNGQEEQDVHKNEHEANLVLFAVKQLMRDEALRSVSSGGTCPVGIVTPYAEQKSLIMSKLAEQGFVNDQGQHLIETNSVDGFQGREKDIIVFSAVRANYIGTVGFLHDWRRINVMLTRARRGLIVIGNRATLKTDFYWNHWLKWASKRGCIYVDEDVMKPGGTLRHLAATGTKRAWKPVCLVEDEWIMRPQKHAISENICSMQDGWFSD